MDELHGIQERYARRAASHADRSRALDAVAIFERQEKERALARWLRGAGLGPVPALRLLEVGCGTGGNLLQFLRLGFAAENLVGNELLPASAEAARRRLPGAVRILEGDARALELPAESFDVVFQSTVFTSILDDGFQEALAATMWALARPGGGVLWYDFVYDNPKNADVRGVAPARIRSLFPDGAFRMWRLTLAPPISRRAARVSPALYPLLNLVPMLRTHVLAWVRKGAGSGDHGTAGTER